MPVYGFPDRRSYDNVSKAAQRVNNRLPKKVGPMRVKEGPGSGTEFYAKATSNLTQGLQPAATTVAEDKGPAWGSGVGEATGDTPEINYIHVRNITSGEWLLCKRIRGKVYCGPVECP